MTRMWIFSRSLHPSLSSRKKHDVNICSKTKTIIILLRLVYHLPTIWNNSRALLQPILFFSFSHWYLHDACKANCKHVEQLSKITVSTRMCGTWIMNFSTNFAAQLSPWIKETRLKVSQNNYLQHSLFFLLLNNITLEARVLFEEMPTCCASTSIQSVCVAIKTFPALSISIVPQFILCWMFISWFYEHQEGLTNTQLCTIKVLEIDNFVVVKSISIFLLEMVYLYALNANIAMKLPNQSISSYR